MTPVYLQHYDDIYRRGHKRDRVHEALKAEQKPLTRHLWVPADAITFTPQVANSIYGDGRALFGIGTINSRPAYWILRGCSTWTIDFDRNAPDGAVNLAEFIDDILNDLEGEFGSADDEPYEWTGGRLRSVETKRFISEAAISYPVVNYGCGCHWFRLNWPELPRVNLEQHPFDRSTNILASSVSRPERQT
jgi:hypothetical protein